MNAGRAVESALHPSVVGTQLSRLRRLCLRMLAGLALALARGVRRSDWCSTTKLQLGSHADRERKRIAERRITIPVDSLRTIRRSPFVSTAAAVAAEQPNVAPT